MPNRVGEARWDGSLQEGHGVLKVASGAYEGPYSFQSRFEEGDGTNPEELIAGAHAGCFSMNLSGTLGRAGYEPESIETTATVHLDRSDAGFSITRIELDTRAQVAGIGDDEFQELAREAERTCPVSRALGGVDTIEVHAQLVS